MLYDKKIIQIQILSRKNIDNTHFQVIILVKITKKVFNMAKNKVFSRYMRPYYFGTGLFSLIILGTGAFAISNAKTKYKSTTESIVRQTVKNYTLSALLVVLCLYMVYFSMISVPKETRNHMKKIADKYADWAIKNYPELAVLKTVKQDETALKELCDFVCNSLNKQEIEQIVMLARQYDTLNNNVPSQEVFEAKVKNIEQEILNILQEHTMLDAGFMFNVAEHIRNHKTIMLKQNMMKQRQ